LICKESDSVQKKKFKHWTRQPITIGKENVASYLRQLQLLYGSRFCPIREFHKESGGGNLLTVLLQHSYFFWLLLPTQL